VAPERGGPPGRDGSQGGPRARDHASTFGTITLRNAEGAERHVVVDIAARLRVR